MPAGSRRRAPNPAAAAPSESPRSDALQRRQAAGHDHHDPFRPPQAPLLLDVSTSHIPHDASAALNFLLLPRCFADALLAALYVLRCATAARA